MSVVANQYTSPESERAEAARGCSRCGEKGHNARTCSKKEEPKTEAKPKAGYCAPPGSVRLATLRTLQDVNIYPHESYEVKTQIMYEEFHPRNKHKWQIWRAPDGWIHVWHDDRQKPVLVGPSNVSWCEPFIGE